MNAKPDFAAVHLKPGELSLIRQLYAETYPVRVLLNRIDELELALNSLWPGLVLDLRYADADDDRDAMQSRVDTIAEVMAGTGNETEGEHEGT